MKSESWIDSWGGVSIEGYVDIGDGGSNGIEQAVGG